MQRGFAFNKQLSFLDTAFQVQKNVVSFSLGANNETLSVAAICVCNQDRSPVGINR
jgi:hypothetical protein